MKFIADLHIHSRFSRATAKNLDFERLYIAARNKGISVVGTGDFTHPGWLSEIKEKLVEAECGLYKLKEEVEAACEKEVTAPSQLPVRFMLSCEISNIYKKNGATRKLHNLVFMPDVAAVERFNARLSDIGNLKSDGRPILGLDSKILLEIALETDDRAFLIPAHIWTPWFAMFGSKSGFDSISDCFEDLTPYIFAIETGLSSDPPMNWRVGELDGITLVSNSDAHSPANLGREANLFDTSLSYDAIRKAIETGDPHAFLGTLEFYPQEGKYHHDGHRKCGIRFSPHQTMEHNRICPECGKPLTLGVCFRVEQLATRPAGEIPEKSHPFYSIIPLAEIISEIVKTGPKSKKVGMLVEKTLKKLGPELHVLNEIPLEKIRKADMPLLAEAISRMRSGDVKVSAGYDGEYGKVRLFDEEEIDLISGQKTLFPGYKNIAEKKGKKAPEKQVNKEISQPVKPRIDNFRKTLAPKGISSPGKEDGKNRINVLDPKQHDAVYHEKGPLLIVAGPGTGKTYTLTLRIARLIAEKKCKAKNILAVTFTHKAAAEMAERLSKMLGPGAALPEIATFHSFCLSLLKKSGLYDGYSVADEGERLSLVIQAMETARASGHALNIDAETVADLISSAKQAMLTAEDGLSSVESENHDNIGPAELSAVFRAYTAALEAERLFDFEDLIFYAVRLLSDGGCGLHKLINELTHVFIDEYQDINYGQYRLVRCLCSKGADVCAIGDPDQSIYGFRGSDPSYFTRFNQDWPGTTMVYLTKCFRSAPAILKAAVQVLGRHRLSDAAPSLHSEKKGPDRIFLLKAATGKAEAVKIGKTIEEMVGGLGFHYHDQGKGVSGTRERSFSDFAVLFRTRAQGEIISSVFSKAGIPHLFANSARTLSQKRIRGIVSLLRITEGIASFMDIKSMAGVFLSRVTRADIRRMRKILGDGLISIKMLSDLRRSGFPQDMSPEGISEFSDFTSRLSEMFSGAGNMTVEEKILSICRQFPKQGKNGVNGPANDSNGSESPSGQDKDIEPLLSMARGYGSDTRAFLEGLALTTDPDFYDKNVQRVVLMTIHASKGLEFPVVFIAGCEDGYLPFRRANGHISDIDEERRLFYVGMTRAIERLYLCRAGKRNIFGKNEKRSASPFVEEIDPCLVEEVKDQDFRPRQRQLTLF